MRAQCSVHETVIKSCLGFVKKLNILLNNDEKNDGIVWESEFFVFGNI